MVSGHLGCTKAEEAGDEKQEKKTYWWMVEIKWGEKKQKTKQMEAERITLKGESD